jgi:hypothetical protein
MTSSFTASEVVDGYVDAVVQATTDRVAVAGMYLIGSLAFDDFQPPTSDVDILVVTNSTTPRPTLQALADDIARIPIPVRGLEYVVYPRPAVEHVAAQPGWQLNLNLGPRLAAPHVGFDPGVEPSYWVALDLAVAREHGIALIGPDPRDLIGEVPDDLVADALRQALEWHEEADPASPNHVLNATRAWRWAETRDLTSKTVAAEWAYLMTGDPVVREALHARATGEGTLDRSAAEAFTNRARQEFDESIATRT